MPDISRSLNAVVDKGLGLQRSAVLKHVDRVRRANPRATPKEIIGKLDRQYLSSVTAMGAGAGASAAVPGNPVGVAVNLLEVGTNLEASLLYVLALAEVYDLPVEDLERRRTLLYAILLGDGGSGVIKKMSNRTGQHWAKMIVKGVDTASLKQINKVLGHNFVTKYGTKQGILVLGREVPFGIGAGIGGAGNALFGVLTVRAAHRAFGPPPQTWPATLPPGADVQDEQADDESP